MDCDLYREAVTGTRGQGLATYKELIRNMSTKTRPEGGALTLSWIDGSANVQAQVMKESGLSYRSGFSNLVERKISKS